MAFTRSKFDTCNLSKICNDNNSSLSNYLDQNRHTNNNNCMFSKYPINKKANLKNVSIESKLMNIDEVLYNCDKYSLEDKEKKFANLEPYTNALLCKNNNYNESSRLNPQLTKQLPSSFNLKLSPYSHSNEDYNNVVDYYDYRVPQCKSNSDTNCAFNSNNSSKIGLNTHLDAIDQYKNELDNLSKQAFNGTLMDPSKNNILNNSPSNTNSMYKPINCNCV